MAGIFQGDVVIKRAIELGIEDMRKNPWLLDHMLEDLQTNPYFSDQFGQAQIDSCKEWFANNEIEIVMAYRKDKDRLPCINIFLQNSQEKEDMKHMADLSTEKVILQPSQIGKPIPYIMKPATPTGYYDDTGEVVFDPSTPSLGCAGIGMILVDPDTGTGYEIKDVTGSSIFIDAGIEIKATQLGIVPKNAFYEARVEHSFFQDTYGIGCHAHGDPSTVIWLHSIALYSLLRYRESLFEANGFSQSSFNSSGMEPYEEFGGPGSEEAWSRYITITGMVENTWIKSPRRFIEKVNLKEGNCDTYTGGIKILSNNRPGIDEEATWYPIDENES